MKFIIPLWRYKPGTIRCNAVAKGGIFYEKDGGVPACQGADIEPGSPWSGGGAGPLLSRGTNLYGETCMYRPLFGRQLEQSAVRTVEQAAELITERTGLLLSKIG